MKAEPFFVRTNCGHCDLQDKHTRVGESHCNTKWTDDEYPPNYASDGYTFYCLKCKQCGLLTIWCGFMPEWYDDDDRQTEEDYEIAFFRFYKPIFPEVKSTKFWPYRVAKGDMHGPVVFFLDQANSAMSIGIHNAAVLSFRSALEAIVDADGTTSHRKPGGGFKMLGTRINELTKSPTPPDWVKHLDNKTLQFLKELGNEAVHVRGLKKYTPELSVAMREMMDIVLDEFYRDPKKELKTAKAKVTAAKKKSKRVSRKKGS